MRESLLSVAAAGGILAFGLVPGAAPAHTLLNNSFVPPGMAKGPGESDRLYTPSQNQASGRHCHRSVQRHLHDTYSHPADHYHHERDCQPIVI